MRFSSSNCASSTAFKAAVKLMDNHLGNVKRNLQLHPHGSDLAALLKPE